jgi:hypothetical protein
MLFVGLLLLLCSLAQAQTPTPCNYPDQWEGYSHLLDVKAALAKGISISYDATNKRVATSHSAEMHGEEKILNIILLYEEKKFYFFHPVDKKCVVLNTTREFQPGGVPENATFDREVIYGFGSNKVYTNVFHYTYQVEKRTEESYLSSPNCLHTNNILFQEERNKRHRSYPPQRRSKHHHHHPPCPPPKDTETRSVYHSLTTETCAPVIRTTWGEYNPSVGYEEALYDQRFHDLTEGIAFPSVFDPPDYCNESSADAQFMAGLQWHGFMYI